MMDFSATRALFDLPDGICYLDGNSLGPQPRAAASAAARALGEWQGQLIGGWNGAGWMDLPVALGAAIAPLIGAAPDTVVVGETLSIRVHQALMAALDLRPERTEIVTDSGNFPSDIYIAAEIARRRGLTLRVVAPDAVETALGPQTAVLMLTEVDYRTARRHDMARLSARAHEVGALALWDLAHSAGAVPLDLAGAGADFAVGCTYKYLNGGPGSPAFLHAAPGLIEAVTPALPGWLGHAAPFGFDMDYAPAPGVARMRIGTPPVLQMAALQGALTVWKGLSMTEVFATAQGLAQRLIDGVAARAPALRLASPEDPARRGSHLAFAHPEAQAIMRAFIARGLVGDFRAPDIVRLALTPLYIGPADIDRALDIIAEVMTSRAWEDPAFAASAGPVT
ncbi:kynureninase [Phaeovulum vinaykumarii]|nr:kynureninase [Phaeovulum vinaykumarii]